MSDGDEQGDTTADASEQTIVNGHDYVTSSDKVEPEASADTALSQYDDSAEAGRSRRQSTSSRRQSTDGTDTSTSGIPHNGSRRASEEHTSAVAPLREPRPIGRQVEIPASGMPFHSRSSLTRTLSVARPDPIDKAETPHKDPHSNFGQLAYFCEARHDAGDANEEPAPSLGLIARWRQKERLKTTAVALVLCLNIGVDPPDVLKISPCARMQCWVDPASMPAVRALDTIGKNLQAQYERWQPKSKYRMHLDPTVDDVKKLASHCRRNSKHERVLFHYNGHGVPRPTANGEIWVFNKSYTQYIPLSVVDLRSWVGTPAIFVFDCSAAGLVLEGFKAQLPPSRDQVPGLRQEDPLRETFLLAACQGNELLPQQADLPADVFTACLTTPIKIALKWFCAKSLLYNEGLSTDLIDRLPGKQNDRTTPLGELNWIFTAITDTIAWNTLPRGMFQKLFRQDLLVASLFRNFLLAERIMRAANCTPISQPRLPPTHQHPMWQAWDRAAEMCLIQIPAIVKSEGTLEYTPVPFFTEQLTAFELWLQHGSKDKNPPEQLPIVLQVLLSQNHRLRALWLLGSFLDMGPWAVDLALCVGIFPYVLKLLQTSASELKECLIFIWTKIFAVDPACYDLVKDGGHLYFIKYLNLPEHERQKPACAHAAFVLSVICTNFPEGQELCCQAGLLETLLGLMKATSDQLRMFDKDVEDPDSGLLVKWLCLCFGKLVSGLPDVINSAIDQSAHDILVPLMHALNPEVRGAAVFALGSLIQGESSDQQEAGEADQYRNFATDRALACHLLQTVYDGSPLVRAETALALTRLASGHNVHFQDAVLTQQRQAARTFKQARQAGRGEQPQAARSLPTESSSGNIMTSPLTMAASHGNSLESLARSANGKLGISGGSGEQSSASPVETAPLANSPGIYVSRTSINASDSAKSLNSGTTSPGDAHMNYASADAARVGNGMYTFVLDALCILATDPTKLVSSVGQTALQIAGVKLQPVHTRTGIQASKSSSQLAPMARDPSVQLPHDIPTTPSTSNLQSAPSATPATGSKWHPRNLLTKSARSLNHAQQSMGSTPASSPTASLPDVFQRAPFILRQVPLEGTDMTFTREDRKDMSRDMSRRSSMHSLHSGEGQEPQQSHRVSFAAESSAELPPVNPLKRKLPESPTYKLAVKFFAETQNDRTLGEWQLMGHSPGYGAPHFTVKAQWQPWRVESRLQDKQSNIAALKTLGRSPELKFRTDQVESISTEGPESAALLLHPFRPLLVAVDSFGIVRVYNSRKPYTLKNCFYISNGEGVDLTQRKRSAQPQPQPAGIVAMWQINQVFNGLLLSGAADGAVRVWRDYTFPRTQTLATGWQAVPVSQAKEEGGFISKCVYDWQETTGCLFAAGGYQPSIVHRWDLEHELCTQQIMTGGENGRGTPISFLAALKSTEQALLTVAGSAVRLFDLRDSHMAATLNLRNSKSLVGMVAEPGGLSNHCILASSTGEVQFIDFRMTGSEGRLGVFKTLQAHTRGNLTALAGHPHIPIIATGTATQVIKLWSASGEQRGVVRTQSSLLASQRMGAIGCLAFHPHRALLASGSADSVITLYPIDGSASTVEQSTVSDTSRQSSAALLAPPMSSSV